MSLSTNQSRSFRWMISFSTSRTFDALFFDDNEVLKFLNKYENLCDDYELKDEEKKRRFFKYCDFINDQYVRSIINAASSWEEIMKILKKKFRNRNVLQQLYFIEYFEAYKNHRRTNVEKMSTYCRQFQKIFDKFIKMKRLQSIIKSSWFLQKLFAFFYEKLVIWHDLNNENVENLNFATLVNQVLALVKSKRIMKSVRKTRFKNDWMTTLMKKMKWKTKKKMKRRKFTNWFQSRICRKLRRWLFKINE